MTGAVRRSAQCVARAGAEVVIAFDEGHPPPDGDGVRWVAVPHTPGRVRLPRDLGAALHGADLLVLHSAWAPANVAAAWAANRAGIPYLLEPRGAYNPRIIRRRWLLKRTWWLLAEQPLVRGARAIHLFFKSERAHLRGLGYDGHTVIAPNGVDVPSEPTWDGGSGGYVLWLGRFDLDCKGLDLLLEALALIPPDERPQLRLHGPDHRGGKLRVVDLIRRLELEQWATVGEPVHGDAKEELVSRSRGFVYPSRWEGFGNSVTEAAAQGVPLLVTPYPLGRYFADRGAAILSEPTPASLADGLLALCSPDAAVLGPRGAAIAREDFDWDRVATAWLRQVAALL